MSALWLVPRACVQTSKVLVEHLVVRPIQGLREIADGIVQAAPDLYRAVITAVVEAVDRRLSFDARNTVRQGIDRIVAGAKLLVPPVALAALVWVILHPIAISCVVWAMVITVARNAG